MSDRNIVRRVWVTAGLLLGGFVALSGLSRAEHVPAHRPLRDLPQTLAAWRGRDVAIEQRIARALGVGDYVNRIYTDGRGGSVSLYIAYYGSQRTGDLIHSPKNCLPGAGWEPMHSRRLTVEVPGESPILVNEYLIQKGLDRQLVLYWYQAQGRVVASEYSAKAWMVVDAMTRNRTDGALIRLVTPIGNGEIEAETRAVQFAQTLCPRLSEFLPD